jgi:hypothetical protein
MSEESNSRTVDTKLSQEQVEMIKKANPPYLLLGRQSGRKFIRDRLKDGTTPYGKVQK